MTFIVEMIGTSREESIADMKTEIWSLKDKEYHIPEKNDFDGKRKKEEPLVLIRPLFRSVHSSPSLFLYQFP